MLEKPLFKLKAIILSVSLIVWITFDQLTKIWAIESIKGLPASYHLGGIVQIVYAENRRAWGGLGDNWPEFLRMSFLIYIPMIFLIGIAVYVLANKKVKLYEATYLSFIVAGGIGNLIDRIRFDYVVDFMYIGYKSLGTNIFNIADVVIMIGFFGIFGLNIKEWKASKL